METKETEELWLVDSWEHKGAFWLTDSAWDDLKRLDLSDLVNAEASWATAWSPPSHPDRSWYSVAPRLRWRHLNNHQNQNKLRRIDPLQTLEKLRPILKRDFYPWAPVSCEEHRSKDRSLWNAAEASTSATFKAVFLIYITQFPLNKTHSELLLLPQTEVKGKTSLQESSFIRNSTEFPEWLMPSTPLRISRCGSAVRQAGRTGKEASEYSGMSRNIWISSVFEVGKCPENNIFHFSAF